MKRGNLWGRVLSAAGLSLSIFLSSFGNVTDARAMEGNEPGQVVETEAEDAADNASSEDDAATESSSSEEYEQTVASETEEYSVTAANMAPREKRDADNSLVTRDNIHDGAILHAFCWSFNTIAENMADIAEAGYTAVQTSPINECLSTNPGMNLHGPDGMWYYHYQPTDWVIGNYQLGSRDEFKHMCDVADEYGVAVIVDILPNHTTPSMGSISDALKEAAGGEDALFHTTGKTGGGYTDRVELTYYSMGGLPDVDTENAGFQQYFYEFLKDCVYLGADGFRIDTCKHISLPDDPVPADYEDAERNNFYTNMRQALDEYSEEVDTKSYDELFVYGEVLQGTNDRLAAYQEYVGGTTASNYGSNIRSALSNGNFSVNRISDYQIYDETVNGRTYTADTEKLVTWVESHDNYMNDSESCWKTIDNKDVILGWSFIAARKDGTPLFFSRPNNSSAENPYGDNLIGAAGDPIYKAPEVKAVNHFRQEMKDAAEYLSNPGGIQTVMVERKSDENEGAVIINSSVNRTSITAETVLEDGIYPNQVEGSEDVFLVKDGVITGSVDGESVVVLDERIDGTGKTVYFYNSDNWSDVVARVDDGENTVNTVNDNDGWYWATVLDDEFNVTFENSDGSAVSPEYTVTATSGTFATLKDSTLYFSKAEAEQALGLNTYSVYFFNTEAWESVNSYGWLDGGSQLFGGWPGTPAVNEGAGWWRADVKSYDDITAFNLIFNNGSGKQTVNIEGITPDSKDIYIAVDAENSGDQLSVLKFTDKAAAEEALGVSGEFTTAYFYNTEGWEKVCAYTWGGTSLGDWPGKDLTQDQDGWYSIVLPAGAGEDLNIIFNNGDNGKQTSDMKITDMKNRFFLHNGITYRKYGSKKEALADVIGGGDVSYTTVYFYNEKASEDSWKNVYLYVFGGTGGEYNNLVGTWPGRAMTRETGTDWYTAEVPSNAIETGTLTYIFNNGNGTQLDDNKNINTQNNYFTTSSTANFESKEAVYAYLGIDPQQPVEPEDPENPVEPEEPQEPEVPEEPEELQGEFVTRWGKTIFVTTDGETVTGLATIQGNKYYFKSNGSMVKSDYVTIDDATYYFDRDGRMVTGFMTKWFSTYYFHEDGAMAKNSMFTADGDTYYANAKGHIVMKDFVTFEDGKRFFDSDGKMVKGTTITRWFKKYTFDDNGLLIG